MTESDVLDLRVIVIRPHQVSDTLVLVRCSNPDHYKTLRLILSRESSSPVFSTKLDPAGYSQVNNPGLLYPLPRLPADNNSYVVSLESTLSKVTHSYEEPVHYFVSDGRFRYFEINFDPKASLCIYYGISNCRHTRAIHRSTNIMRK